jgi:hypothetical protein
MTGVQPETGKARGGVARAKSMTPAQRSAAASKAAAARWQGGDVIDVICGSEDRPLQIGDISIGCYVLADGTRVLTQGDMLRAMGRARTVRRISNPDDGLPPILQGKAIRPYISDEVREKVKPIAFRTDTGRRALGYNAELLPAVCDVYLHARADGALPTNQQPIAEQAEILVRGLARVGIIALVDEATGYQDVRTSNALAKILEAFVDKELQAWVTTFPVDYYKEMFRLRNLEYATDTVHRPQYFGHLTNDVVYNRIAPGVLHELKRVQRRDDKGRPKDKLFQRLTTNKGYPKLREHLGSVVAIMKLSKDWADFKVKLDMIHPQEGATMMLPFDSNTWETDDGEGL